MANRYWVGGDGNWNETIHWSATSGGSGGASTPTSSDDVFFDANSATGNLQVIQNNNLRIVRNITFATTNRIDFIATNLYVLQDLVHNANTYYQALSGLFYLSLSKAGNVNFDNKFDGQTADVYLDVAGVLVLQSNIKLRSLTIKQMQTNNYDIGITNLTLNSGRGIEIVSGGGTVNLGTSNIRIYSNGVALSITNSNKPLVQGSNSNIYLYNAGTTSQNLSIIGSGIDFGNLYLNPDNNARRYSIQGSHTVKNLIIGRNTELFMGISGQSAPTLLLDDLTAVGTLGEPISIRSYQNGQQYVFRKTSGTVTAEFVNLRDSVANGGATFNNYRGTDSGNNVGWNFTGPSQTVANFTQDKTSGSRPLAVQFTDTSTGGDITSWSWNFGDSTGSSAQNPLKTYTTPGTYTVSLTVTNVVGSNTITKTNLMTVTINSLLAQAIGNIVLGGGSNPTTKFKREAKGNVLIGGGAYAVIKKNLDAVEEKKYIAKIYSDTGVYLETWSRDVISEVSFSQEINEIGSTVELELARNSDSLGQTTTNLTTEAGDPITTQSGDPIQVSVESRNQVGPGSTVIHNNRVDLYVYYGMTDILTTESGEPITTDDGEELLASVGAPNGLRVFTGFIAEISTKYGSTETTSVLLNSYGWDLDQYVLDNTLGATTLPYNSVDPSDIARQVMTRFAAVAEPGSYTKATTTSISTTGTIVSYTFKSNTYAEVLKKVLELMPSNWYFYVGLGDNTVYFRERATLPVHVFYIGKHIKDLDLRSYIGDSVNHIYFTGGNIAPEGEEQSSLYKEYKEAPAPRTRRTLYNYSDNRVTLDSSADILSEGLIELKNKVQYRTTIEILTKQYDIETINVGDTVGFRNFDTENDQLVMQVIAKTYTPDVVTLQLDTKPVTVNKRLEDVTRNLSIAENANLPSTPS